MMDKSAASSTLEPMNDELCQRVGQLEIDLKHIQDASKPDVETLDLNLTDLTLNVNALQESMKTLMDKSAASSTLEQKNEELYQRVGQLEIDLNRININRNVRNLMEMAMETSQVASEPDLDMEEQPEEQPNQRESPIQTDPSIQEEHQIQEEQPGEQQMVLQLTGNGGTFQ